MRTPYDNGIISQLFPPDVHNTWKIVPAFLTSHTVRILYVCLHIRNVCV